MTDKQGVHGLSRSAANTAQIPLPRRRWKTRVLLPAVVVIAVLGLIGYATWDRILPATAVRAVPVLVKSVSGDASRPVTVQAPGWLEPDPHLYYVSALTDGVVATVLALEGEQVKAGQVVARLIDDDATLARERALAAVEGQRAAVDAAEAEVAAAEATMKNLVERTEAVDSAQAAVEALVAERARLDAEIEAAKSTALVTKDELDRKSGLVTSQAVSRGDVARLRLRLASEQAALRSKRAAIPVLVARRKAADARLKAARRNKELLIEERRAVRSAKAMLLAARAAERDATARLAEADLRLARTKVRAATAGTVLQRIVSPGSRIQVTSAEHSAHVLHLYDPNKLQVRVDVPLADAAQVGLDQRAEIVVDALPDRVFKGVVTRLVHLADISKRTVEVKVGLQDPVPLLKPEMLARVRFLASRSGAPEGELRQRIFAPKSAVQSAGGGSRVLVVSELTRGRGRVRVQDVELGSTEIEDHVEVVSGLRPGDQVIVDAPADLDAGDRVVLTGGGR